MPASGAASTTVSTARAPARCPAVRANPRRSAQRPLPSMMIAAWSEPLCFTKFLPKKKRYPSGARAGGPDDAFHVGEILLQRLAADGGETVLGARHPSLERFQAFEVAGLFEATGVHAEVAVGGADQVLELVEGERLGHGERAHDRQPDPLVDEAVERERGPGGGAAIFFFFPFASDGAAEIAIAITATAPTNRTLDNDFMRTPSVKDREELHGE